MAQPRILLIEDNEENLALMVFILKHFGFSCVTANDGDIGLQRSKQEKFDLIVCDIHLPTLSGFDVIAQLQRDEYTKDIPVIAVTAYAMLGDKEKILSAGFRGYISKPIEATTFANQIQSFLRGNDA